VRISSVIALLIVAGCGRLGFDGMENGPLTAKLVVGSSTADLELCGEPSTFWITTAPIDGEWTPETLAERVASLPMLHSGRTAPGEPCTTISSVLVEPQQIPIYAYAVNDELDEAVEVTETMKPSWTKETTAGGISFWVHRPEWLYRDSPATAPVLMFLHGWGHSTGVNAHDYGVDTMPRDSGFLEWFGNNVVGNPERTRGLIDQPFLVVAPNCAHLGDLRGTQLDCWGWASGDLIYDETMHHVRDRFPIDNDRIYATGLSTGGEGAFRLAVTRSDEIAAAVPIASTYSSEQWFSENLCAAVDVPIWAFHSIHDTTNSATVYTNSVKLVDTLNGCPSTRSARLDLGEWMTNGEGHSGWLDVYRDTHGKVNDAFTSIYPWLLAHRR
jgi:poly(3-hydroxybutyrate) depolymerase